MNNWVNDNKQTYYRRIPKEMFGDTNDSEMPVEAIPVSALEELFSKSGEQLARFVYPFQKPLQDAFENAYNIQEVKIAELKDNIFETIYSHYKASGGYTRTAAVLIEKITGEKWERDKEFEALGKENEALKKELEELKAQLYRYKPLNPQP